MEKMPEEEKKEEITVTETGEVVTKEAEKEERERRLEDPNWFREQK